MKTRPPKIATVAVTIDAETCKISSQTATKTCPFQGPEDPEDIVCQEPSPKKDSAARRKIEWTSATAFTLEFDSGNPFKNTPGQCKLDVANTRFTCLIRKESEKPPLQPGYKYAIVAIVEDPDEPGKKKECKLDPRVYLMR